MAHIARNQGLKDVALQTKFKRSQRVSNYPTVAPDARIYAIGDIHGCFDLMILLLERIVDDAEARADGRRPYIVFLGDYIDRGDDSKRVLETLSRLGADNHSNAIFLRGNHEAMLQDFLRDPIHNEAWLQFGAATTLSSYGLEAPRRRDPRSLMAFRDDLASALKPVLPFIASLKTSYTSGDVVFVHAAVVPFGHRTKDPVQVYLWGHSGFQVPEPVPGHRIVHGHYDAAAPISLPGRICVDTGAYHTGQLTAVRIDDGEGYVTATLNEVWS